MSPTHPSFYPADLRLTDAKVIGDFLLRARVKANFFNILFGQFCRDALFTNRCRSMAQRIRHVPGLRIPAKVGQGIILVIAIVVAAKHAWWARTSKGYQHQKVHSMVFPSTIPPEANPRAPIFAIVNDCPETQGSGISYPAKVGNLIKAFISGNWKPHFHCHWCGIIQLTGQL